MNPPRSAIFVHDDFFNCWKANRVKSQTNSSTDHRSFLPIHPLTTVDLEDFHAV